MSAGLNHFGLQIEKAIRKTSFSLGDTQKHTQIERKGVGERGKGEGGLYSKMLAIKVY